MGPLLFLIMISDIDKDVSASKLVSFADDTRLYHGILLLKLRAVGITGNIGIWLFHFLTDRSHFVRLHGGIRLYSGVGDVTDCDKLQLDLNAVYDWVSSNNMILTPKSLV